MNDYLYSRTRRQHKESRNDKKKRAVKDIRDLIEIGQTRNQIIEAIYIDYEYSPSTIYNLIKEAVMQIRIAQNSKEIGVAY